MYTPLGHGIHNELNNHNGTTKTTQNAYLDNLNPTEQNYKNPTFAVDTLRIPAGTTSSGALKPLRIGRPSYYIPKLRKSFEEAKPFSEKGKLAPEALPSTPKFAPKSQQKSSDALTGSSKTTFDSWLETNQELISDTQLQEAIHFLETESGTRIDRIIVDGRWHYLDKKQKHGYIAKCEKDHIFRPRLQLTYHSFKHGGDTTVFNDLGVLYNLWEAEKANLRYKSPIKKRKRVIKNKKDDEKDFEEKKQKFEDALEKHLKSPQAAKSNYLKEKKLPIPQGVKGWNNFYNNSLISLPIINSLGQVIGLQQIFDKTIEGIGNKLFKGKTKGGFVFICEGKVLTELPEKLKGILVCEGFATGMSLHIATGLPVACALSADNIQKVVAALRNKYGSRSKFEIIICADNDELRAKQINPKTGKVRGNIGLEKACDAALKYNCNVCAPDFKGSEGTDFNDLYVSSGVTVVKETVKNRALPKPLLAFAKELRKLASKIGDKYVAKLSEIIDGITCIKSPQNTGKTQAISEVIREFREQGISVINITHRELLATHLGKRLKLEGYKDLTARDMRIQSGLSICVDSLHKISGCTYDVVVIDESEQFVNNLKSKHIKNKNANLEVLTHLIKNAKKVICLDADLGNLTHTLVNLLRPEAERKVINNHYFVGEDKNLSVYQKRGNVLAKAKQTLEDNKTLLHVCNGLGESEKVYQLLKELFPDKKGLLINSETSNSPEVREVINNPSKLSQYDYVVASPSLQTGVSIEGDLFDVITGTFFSVIGTPDDCLQQIWRSRNTKDIHVWVETRNIYKSYDDETLEAPFFHTYNKERELLSKDEHGIHNDFYKQIKIEAEKQERKVKSNYRYNFLKLATLQGFNVELVECKDKAANMEAQEMTELARVLGEQNYADNRVLARDITAKEASELASKQALSTEETYELDKYMIKHTFRYETDEGKDAARVTVRRKQKIDPDDFEDDLLLSEFIKVDNRGKLQKAVRNFELTFKTEEQLKETANELEEKNQLIGDIENVASKQQFNRKLLSTVGFSETLDGEQIRYDKHTLMEFVQWIEDNRKWLKGIMDLPSKKQLTNNPCRYVGSWLRKLGLDHKRVGANVGSPKYTLNPEVLNEMNNWVKIRGEVVICEDSF